MATFDGSDDLDAEQTPVFDRMNKEYRIYVNNLPEELKEDAIKQVFNTYGNVTGIFYSPNASWAFITYGSYREAELAIRELNNRKPLYLQVSLAKERIVKEELEQLDTELKNKPYITDIERKLYVTEPVLVQNVKRIPQSKGRGYTPRECIAIPDITESYKYIPHHEEARSSSAVSSAYENDDPYMSTNRLWTRGTLTVTADGKRHVSLGRGYSMYEIPEPDPKCEEYITQVYELRKNRLYEYGDDKLQNGLQTCIVCSAKTTKRCEKCHTYYCSKACQVTHWPRHQIICERIPNLVDETAREQVSKNEDTKSQSTSNTRTQVNTFSDVKLRRPNTPVQVQSSSTNTQRTNCTNQTNDTKTTDKTTDKYPNNQLDNKGNVAKEKIDQPAVNTINNRTLQNRLNRYDANENIDQTKRNDQFPSTVNHIRQNQHTYGYKNDSTNKTFSDKETNKNNYVKDKFNNNGNRSHFHQRNGFQNDKKPPYNHRETTISNKQEQKIPMLSMDAEKTMTVEMEERLDNLDACTVKDSPQSSNTSSTTVKTPQEKSSPNTENTPAIQLCNILDAFADSLTKSAAPELNISGILQIFDRTQNVYSATLVPYDFMSTMEKIINDLPAVCKKMTETVSNYKPQVGDLVCSEMENGEWYRGYVTSSLPDLRIAAVDEARILPATRALPYPKQFLDICTYGVTCEVTNAELEVECVYNFTAVVKEHNKKQGSLKIKIENSEKNFIEAVIKPWQPAAKLVPALAELRNGSKIHLSSYRNQYTMFALSLDESEIEYTTNIAQRVAHCAQTAPHLSKLPITKQMVIAPYVDGNKYRAMITKMQDKIATIVYVDFGNFTTINVDELQEIPDDLQVKRSCSARLLLKDVPQDTPMTAEVDAYLRDLVGREEPLVCTYDNGLFKNGVYLTTSTGENVNNKIKELLIPSWKKDNYDDKTCYMINDMDVVPLGKVGETVEALVLYHCKGQLLAYMLGPYDPDLITHVTDEMSRSIQEYCKNTQYYVPRKNELCLALFDETWYRAICFDPKKSQTTCEIFFVDYGNIELVKHQDVRQMPETFLRPAAMASACTVVNLAPVDNAGNYSGAVMKKVSELMALNTPIVVKIVEFVGMGEYKVELPEIRAVLEKEGLIPSSF